MSPLGRRLIGVHVEATSLNEAPPTPGRALSFWFGAAFGVVLALWILWGLK